MDAANFIYGCDLINMTIEDYQDYSFVFVFLCDQNPAAVHEWKGAPLNVYNRHFKI